MAFSIYLGNLPEWVTNDDIKSWFDSSNLTCGSVRVIRNFQTHESKGYAFVETTDQDEVEAVIRRFHRAPIDGRLLQAKEAHRHGEQTPTKSTSRRRKPRSPNSNDTTHTEAETPIGNFGEVLQKAL
jgi:RNA recognition motif-containing protein